MIRRKLAKYGAIFTTQLQSAAAYPLDLAARSLAIVLFMVVFFGLWRAAYAGQGGGTIAGLSLRDTLWYLMLAETIMLSRPRLAQTIAAQVKDGSIAYLLNKQWAVGVEYRVKPDRLNPSILGDALREDDWKDVFVAWAPNKHVSLTAAYVDLGSIVPGIQPRRQRGVYGSIQFAY